MTQVFISVLHFIDIEDVLDGSNGILSANQSISTVASLSNDDDFEEEEISQTKS